MEQYNNNGHKNSRRQSFGSERYETLLKFVTIMEATIGRTTSRNTTSEATMVLVVSGILYNHILCAQIIIREAVKPMSSQNFGSVSQDSFFVNQNDNGIEFSPETYDWRPDGSLLQIR